MQTKITVSFLYQYYKEEDEILFDFLLADITSQHNHDQVKYFIHKYDVLNNCVSNIKFHKNSQGNIDQIVETIFLKENYHYNLILAKEQWVHFFSVYAAKEHSPFNMVMTFWHSTGCAFKNRNRRISDVKIQFNSQLNTIAKNITEYTTNTAGALKSDSDIYLGLIPNFVLADALTISFPQKKIDLLLFANCFTQTFESGLIFSSTAKYLGATEATISNIGINLIELFKFFDIGHQSTIDIDATINNIITNYPDKFREQRIIDYFLNKKDNIERTLEEILSYPNFNSFSINCLTNYPELLEHLNNLVREVRDDAIFLNSSIDVRNRESNILCRDTSLVEKYPLGFIDAVNLFEKIFAQTKFPVLDSQTIPAFKEVVKGKYFPEVFFDINHPQNPYSIMPNGMSIFFPNNKSYLKNLNERLYSAAQFFFKLMFEKNIDLLKISGTEWYTFLSTYFNS